VYGFLGSNGAGKTTAIRLLLNFIQPTSGTATIMGKDVVKDTVAVRQHIGYLSGEIALWPKVTGNELFAYLSKLQKTDSHIYLAELIKRFEAEPDKKIGELSKGNRQKIGIIQALMHQPEVLILDEPTSGLDPLMQEVFYQTIQEASARGAAVFVSSHNLAEAQRMCTKVGIIKHGRLIREQAIHNETSLATPVFRIVCGDEADITRLRAQKTLKLLSSDGKSAVLQPIGSIAAALKELSTYSIVSLTTEQLNLEDEFLEYYGDGA
jgi:ABC-2 type transport system ATP-binding protein